MRSTMSPRASVHPSRTACGLSDLVGVPGRFGGLDFELRIPVHVAACGLRDLSALADCARRPEWARRDARARDCQDRLQSRACRRRSLLRRLELAATDEEAESIRRRLDLVAGEINGLRSQLRGLRLPTDYAVVTVSLLPKDGNEGGGAGGSVDDALGDAGDLFVGVAGVIVRVLAVALRLADRARVRLGGRAFTAARESALA